MEVMKFSLRRKIFHRESIGRLLNDWKRGVSDDVKQSRKHA
jgi:hypothetical protein